MKINLVTTKEYILTQEEASELVYSLKNGDMGSFGLEFIEQVEELEGEIQEKNREEITPEETQKKVDELVQEMNNDDESENSS